ncbi:hypothetical protein [Jannaschia pohangensis]|uniref:Uncharacterized protein n=1 Tax=Jannaschia pohangensis TaxID=390807 RepID=A0A1I3T5X7_9RHOB|nr:hypothetical protein [Jannaschia pohangensis]SFJ65993.1 hypothetical protein SAMN04488095_3295 [Jannaschia pohangensis]
MKMRIVGVLAVVAVVAAGVVAYLQTVRTPWAEVKTPVLLTASEFKLIEGLDGPDLTVTGETHGFFADAIIDLANQLSAILDEGYAAFDPDAGTLTFYIAGQTMVSPVSMTDGRVQLAEMPGSGAAFIDPSTDALAFTFLAPIEGFGDDIALSVTFVTTEDVADRIAGQQKLQEDQRVALAAWQVEVDRLTQALAQEPSFSGPTRQLRLPGWRHWISVPVDLTWGNWPDFPRLEFQDPAGLLATLNVFITPEGEAGQVLAAERAAAIDAPPEQLALLHDTDDGFVIARVGQPHFAMFRAGSNGVEYLVWTKSADVDDIATVRAAASSIVERDMDAAEVLTAPADMRGRMAGRGLDLTLDPDSAARLVAEMSDLFKTTALMSKHGFAKAESSIYIKKNAEDFPFASVGVLCRPEPDAGIDLSTYHPEFIASAGFRFAAFAHSTQSIAIAVETGAFAQNREMTEEEQSASMTHGNDLLPEALWLADGPDRSVGVAGPMFFVYLRRPGAALDMICGLSHEDPVTLRLFEQGFASLEFPAGPENLPLAAETMFRRYPFVRDFAPDLFEVPDTETGGSRIVRADGTDLLGRAYDQFRTHDAVGVFTARIVEGQEGLWTFDGEQLLPPIYTDFDEAEDIAPGVMRVESGDRVRYFSVPERRFINVTR